jgi:hypothetical protein
MRKSWVKQCTIAINVSLGIDNKGLCRLRATNQVGVLGEGWIVDLPQKHGISFVKDERHQPAALSISLSRVVQLPTARAEMQTASDLLRVFSQMTGLAAGLPGSHETLMQAESGDCNRRKH